MYMTRSCSLVIDQGKQVGKVAMKRSDGKLAWLAPKDGG